MGGEEQAKSDRGGDMMIGVPSTFGAVTTANKEWSLEPLPRRADGHGDILKVISTVVLKHLNPP